MKLPHSAAVRPVALSLVTASLLCTAHAQTPNPTPDLSKDRVLYLNSYSHLDTEWCWTYRQSILEYIPNTLRDNFELFEKFPHYVFNWTGANRYRIMKEYYPAEYQKLKGYVAAGRWIPTGSAWEECDLDLPSPESLIRQVLYGNRLFKQEFGKTPTDFFMPDAFGFPASLPSILSHAGLKGFSTQKLTYGAGSAVGVPFNVGRWVGPDGQSIVAALNSGPYRTKVTEDMSRSEKWIKRVNDTGAPSGVYSDYIYVGDGDYGGSMGAESAKWAEASLAGTGPLKIVMGASDAIYNDLTATQVAALPSYKGDLLLIQHSAGSISSNEAIKFGNRAGELLAEAAEQSATAQFANGGSYPAEQIRDGWHRLLNGQFHDVLAGTSIPLAMAYAFNDQAISRNVFGQVDQAAVRRIASKLETRGGIATVLVRNTASHARADVTVVSLPTALAGVVKSATGPDGVAVPLQKLAGDKVAFKAVVPSVGLAVYRLTAKPAVSDVPLKATTNSIENQRYRVHLSSAGEVDSILDKANLKELLKAPIRLAFQREKPERHPAWNMDWADQQLPPMGYVDGPAKIEIAENGPVRVALRVVQESRGSQFVRQIRLSAGSDRVEFVDDIDWRSTECCLKAVLPLTVSNPKATYSWGLGTVQRGNNDPKKYEVPCHSWFDLTDTNNQYGVTVLTGAKYGSDKPTDDTVRLTLLYTPGVKDSYQHQGTQDWGHHSIPWAIVGHKGSWQVANSPAAAAAWDRPLQSELVDQHPGSGRSDSWATISTGVEISAFKRAEDGDEVIVRLTETLGKGKQAKLKLAWPILRVREVDGQERTIAGSTPTKLVDGQLVVDTQPYRPRAFALRVKRGAMAPAAVVEPVLSAGPSYSAVPLDLAPQRIQVDGRWVSMNANAPLRAKSQTWKLPKGKSLTILVSSEDGDVLSDFSVNGKVVKRLVAADGGFLAQPETRTWAGTPSEHTFAWPYSMTGITPAFSKDVTLAWYADQRRTPDGKRDPYACFYVFQIQLPLRADAENTITLPNDPKVRIYGASMIK